MELVPIKQRGWKEDGGRNLHTFFVKLREQMALFVQKRTTMCLQLAPEKELLTLLVANN